MILIGGSGYYVVFFEVVVLELGDWIFVCWSVNMLGELFIEVCVIIKKFGVNFGQVIDKIIQEFIDVQQCIDQEKIEWFNEDVCVVSEVVVDVIKKVNDVMVVVIVYVDVIGVIVVDLIEVDEWEVGKIYLVGDFIWYDGKLYWVLCENIDVEFGVFLDDWQLVGNFFGVGEVLVVLIDMVYQNVLDLVVEVGCINVIVVCMLVGDGKVVLVEVVDVVSGWVEEIEEGLCVVGDCILLLEVQIMYKYVGDCDWNVGDWNVYVGVCIWQLVIVQGDWVVVRIVDLFNVELGVFKVSVMKFIELIVIEQVS